MSNLIRNLQSKIRKKETEEANVLALEDNFPIYCIKTISERHILIGGGGGTSKTGISNRFEIFELTYDSISNTARATRVTKHVVDGHAIMNMCVIPLSKYLSDIPCGGMQGMCYIYEVKFTLKNGINARNYDYLYSKDEKSSNSLRRRHFSLSSQHSSIDDIEENIEEIHDETLTDFNQSETKKPKSHDDHVQNSNIKENKNIPDYAFQFELKASFQTDFHSNDPYQKILKYSSNLNIIFSAGADGKIRLWDPTSYELLATFEAHDNEIDDIDLHPSGKHLASVSKDGKSLIWNVSNGKLITTLDHTELIPKPKENKKLSIFANAKYSPRLCRYSVCEGNENNVRLFVVLNTRSKLDSFICKWFVHNDKYLIEKIVSAGDVPLFTMAISDNGRFLAVGRQTGHVDVYITWNLKRCYHLQAHSLFPTAIEFLPTNPVTMELVGGQVDAALISVSVDGRIVLHKILKRATLGFFGSFLFFVLFMFFIYVTMNYFDL